MKTNKINRIDKVIRELESEGMTEFTTFDLQRRFALKRGPRLRKEWKVESKDVAQILRSHSKRLRIQKSGTRRIKCQFVSGDSYPVVVWQIIA